MNQNVTRRRKYSEDDDSDDIWTHYASSRYGNVLSESFNERNPHFFANEKLKFLENRRATALARDEEDLVAVRSLSARHSGGRCDE